MTSVDETVATDSGGAGHPPGPVRVDLVFEPGRGGCGCRTG